MWKNTLAVAVLGLAGAGALISTGCASESEKPNAVTGVTGEQTSQGMDRAAYDQWGQYHSEWEGKPEMNPSFYDSKHHYHPEWVYPYTH
jgi:hypothetical protein